MSSVIITEQGCRLIRDGGQLVVKKENQKIFVRPLIQIQNIILMGRMEVSHGLIAYALKNGLRISWLTMRGLYRGHLAGGTARNIPLRLRQFELLRQPEKRLALARPFIMGKVNNYGRLIYKKAPVVYEAFRERLQNVRGSIAACSRLQTLRGLEGSFSHLYFRNLPSLLIESFGFRRRIKHPPPDPLNILLSLAYSALFNNIYALVEAAGLDPYCGIFHETAYGHPALVSDLMEEFRAPLADAIVIALVNRRQITPAHFSQEKGRVTINREGVTLFFETRRKQMERRINYDHMKLTYPLIMEQQIRRFIRVLKGKEEVYEPYRYR